MKKALEPIIEITLENELDLVLAYKKGRQLAEVSGLSFADQTKFTTAVSEICRNALTHAGKGEVKFYITNEHADFFIEAIISDQGPGVKDIEELLNTISVQPGAQKTGIFNCRKLSDVFDMESPEEGGTCVRVGRRIPANHPPITSLILSGWRKHFNTLSPVSPYDELKKQNQHLLQALEEIKNQEIQTQNQLEEIKALNRELERNYGKIKELSDEGVRACLSFRGIE